MTESGSFDLSRFMNRTRAASRTAALSRRSLLRGTAVGGLSIAGLSALSACGVKGAASAVPSGSPKVGMAGKDYSDAEKIVNFANWPAYIDVDSNNQNVHPTLKAFQQQTGITVNYKEVINDNNDWYTKINPSLVKGVDTTWDLMVVSDYMVPKYRQYNYIQALDLANIPNHGNMLPAAMNDPIDQGRKFSTPWAYGYTTIAYNSNLVKTPITSIAELFTRPDLKGKVNLFAEMEDTMALALLALGHNPSNFTDAQFNEALDYIKKAKDSGQVSHFSGNDYLGPFQQGNTAVTMAYSGDVAQLGKPNLVTVDLPKEGMLSWNDNLVIPNYARHKKNAERLMNYFLTPQVNAQLDDSIDYIPVVQGAVAALQTLDPATAKSPLIVPTAQMQAGAHGFMSLSVSQLDDYTSRFQQVTGQ